jgi:hypothetical protein
MHENESARRMTWALESAVHAAYDQGTVADFLAQELFSAAVWREGKADQYPDDDRNLPAAEHLVPRQATLFW